MTTHTWTTRADVPPGPWAAMCADMGRLLTVASTQPGAVVTNPEGTGTPVLDGNLIAFTVQTAGGGPLTVQFSRQAGSGQCETSSPLTDGLVVATLARAARHFGALLVAESQAGTSAKAVAHRIAVEMFEADDEAINGIFEPSPYATATRVTNIVMQALEKVASGENTYDVAERLDTVIGELTAQRDGWLAAAALIAPPIAPLPYPAA